MSLGGSLQAETDSLLSHCKAQISKAKTKQDASEKKSGGDEARKETERNWKRAQKVKLKARK